VLDDSINLIWGGVDGLVGGEKRGHIRKRLTSFQSAGGTKNRGVALVLGKASRSNGGERILIDWSEVKCWAKIELVIKGCTKVFWGVRGRNNCRGLFGKISLGGQLHGSGGGGGVRGQGRKWNLEPICSQQNAVTFHLQIPRMKRWIRTENVGEKVCQEGVMKKETRGGKAKGTCHRKQKRKKTKKGKGLEK